MPDYNYLVHKSAASFLNQDANNNQAGRCQNMRLLMSRYVPEQVINDDDYQVPSQRRGRMDTLRYQDTWMQDLVSRFDVDMKNRDWKSVQQAIYARWQATTAHSTSFTGELLDRMVIGLGGGGVLETGITLDHVSGLPIIPGSALKGITRAYANYVAAGELAYDFSGVQPDSQAPTRLQALDDILGESNDARATLLQDYRAKGWLPSDWQMTADDLTGSLIARLYQWAFGNQASAGALVFYDAVLAGWNTNVRTLFDIDIMNPHYPNYHQKDGKNPPSDNQNPVPIKFLTVSKGVKFGFAMGMRKGVQPIPEEFDTVLGWYRQGLQELGVGAKTRSGYGMFNIDDAS
jgi:CRISPR-associated protein Cmr6